MFLMIDNYKILKKLNLKSCLYLQEKSIPLRRKWEISRLSKFIKIFRKKK